MTEAIETQRQAAGLDPDDIETVADFAAALTELRLRVGRSIRDVARTTAIPSATLGGYFSGRHLPPTTQPQLIGQILTELGVDDPDQIDRWREALLRLRRAPASRVSEPSKIGTTPSGTAGPSPYRGLEPFSEHDARLFFGREEIVDTLVDAVERRAADRSLAPLIVVVGPSGSGKSSVLRAGLIPRIRTRPGSPWSVGVLVPGADPMAAWTAARAEIAGSGNVLLVVDQAEELFSPEVSAEQRRAFMQALDQHTQPDGRMIVVAGLRADFYGQAANEPEVLPSLQNSQLVLGAMSIDELRRAIVRPAEAAGVHVDADLVELLLRDLTPRGQGAPGYDAGALPLVSHALLATWHRHTGDRLTVADYLATGGIAGAVQQTAEQMVAGLDAPGRTAAQWLFTQLVIVDDDGAMIRRRVSHDDLRHPDPTTDLALDPVIETFITGRLLTAGDGTLEISHDALLTAWPRLRDWVLTDLDAARLQHRLADAAAAWRASEQDPALLLRGGPLAEAQSLAARPPTSPRTLTAAEHEFVAASGHAQEQAILAEQHRTNRLRALVAVMTALALLAGLLAAAAIAARNTARAQEQLATAARDEATSRQLAIAADDLRETDPALAAQLALAAYRTSTTMQARSSMLASTGANTPSRIVGPVGEMHAAASPDGSVLAVSSTDGTTRIWQRTNTHSSDSADHPGFGGAPDATLQPVTEASGIYASTFSPDGTLLALGTANGEVVLWDLSEPTSPTHLTTLTAEGSVKGVAFSADGRQLAAGTSQPGIQRWRLPARGSGDPAQPTELPTITDVAGMVNSVAYSPTANVLAAGSSDGTIRLWSAPDNGAARLLDSESVGEPTDFVFSVAFDHTGDRLASGEKSRAARIWDVSNPRSIRQIGEPFTGFASWVNSVAFSPDGTQLAAGSSDSSTRLYDAETGTPQVVLPNPTSITGVQYVGERQLLTSEVDGIARLWPLPGPIEAGFGDTIWNVLTSADGSVRVVAPGAVAGSLHLFDEATQQPLGTLLTPPEDAGRADGAAGLSPDGQWVAAGTAIGNVAVWHRPAMGGAATLVDVVSGGKQLIEGVTISAKGLLASISDDSFVVVWQLAEGAKPKELHRLAAEHLPLGVAISPDSTLLAVANSGGEVQLWRLADPDGTPLADPVALPTLTGFDNYAYGLAFDPSGTYLAAGSTDRTTRIWDLTDPAAAIPVGVPLRGPRDTVYGLGWSKDSTRLAAASKEGTVWLWDVTDPADPKVTATLNPGNGTFYSVLLSPDGRHVSGAGSAATVTTWQTDAETVAGWVCASTGTAMSEAEWQQSAPGVPYSAPCPTTEGNAASGN